MGFIKFSPKAKKYRDKVVYILAKTGLIFVKILPHFLLHFFAWVGGLSIWYFSPFTRRVILANLKIAFPESTMKERVKIGKSSLYSLCMTTMESFWFVGSPKRIQKYVSVTPEMHQILKEAHAKGDGAIYIVAHLGNWEMAGIAYPQIIGGHVYPVARTFNNSAIDDLMTQMRTANGNGVIKSNEAAKGMIKALRAGKMVPTLIDQNSSVADGGVFVDFCGLPVPASRAPAKFALKLNCDIFIVNLIRQKGGKLKYEILKFNRETEDEVALTQALLYQSQSMLKKYPQQYLWFYKRFRYIPRELNLEQRKLYPFYANLTHDSFYPANQRRKDGDTCENMTVQAPSQKTQPIQTCQKSAIRKWTKPLRDKIAYYSAALGIAILKILPLCGIKLLAKIGQLAMWYCRSDAKSISMANLKIAFPDMSEKERYRIAKESIYSLALTSLTPFWFSGNLKRIDKHITITPEVREVMEQVVSEGKGTIYVTSHFGNWEMAALAYTHNYPGGFTSIARTFNNSGIDKLVTQMRTVNGNKVIKTNEAAKGMLKALRKHEIVATVNDQNTPIAEGGVFVDFFGIPVPTSTAPARFAIKTACNLMMVQLIRTENDQYKYIVERIYYDGLNEVELTQKILKSNEKNIAKYPEQYLWFYKRFLNIPRELPAEKRGLFPYYAVNTNQKFYGVSTRQKNIGDVEIHKT